VKGVMTCEFIESVVKGVIIESNSQNKNFE